MIKCVLTNVLFLKSDGRLFPHQPRSEAIPQDGRGVGKLDPGVEAAAERGAGCQRFAAEAAGEHSAPQRAPGPARPRRQA